jgi:hypothetical protein
MLSCMTPTQCKGGPCPKQCKAEPAARVRLLPRAKASREFCQSAGLEGGLSNRACSTVFGSGGRSAARVGFETKLECLQNAARSPGWHTLNIFMIDCRLFKTWIHLVHLGDLDLGCQCRGLGLPPGGDHGQTLPPLDRPPECYPSRDHSGIRTVLLRGTWKGLVMGCLGAP